ncbi:MAG: hypothetical protein NC299_14615, partial [Lachnospiraceae bacterium]|nr:hypothetical protein [Lachnospiraceae bacterium]
ELPSRIPTAVDALPRAISKRYVVLVPYDTVQYEVAPKPCTDEESVGTMRSAKMIPCGRPTTARIKLTMPAI